MGYKTNPKQKIVKVNKQVCNKENLYATINLEAMSKSAIDLDAGAFKLWVYFAKNQNNYEFALSSKDANDTFGLKKKQYDNAVAELIEKGYLVQTEGLHYTFNEVPVVSKGNNEEINDNSVVSKGNNHDVSKGNNVVVSKGNNELYPKDTRNITDSTYNTTMDNTMEALSTPYGDDKSSMKPVEEEVSKPEAKEESKCGSDFANPIIVSRDWLLERYNQHEWVNYSTINVFKWNVDGNFYKIGHPSNLRA